MIRPGHKPNCECVGCNPRKASNKGDSRKIIRAADNDIKRKIEIRKDIKEAIRLQESRKVALIQNARPKLPPTKLVIPFADDDYSS